MSATDQNDSSAYHMRWAAVWIGALLLSLAIVVGLIAQEVLYLRNQASIANGLDAIQVTARTRERSEWLAPILGKETCAEVISLSADWTVGPMSEDNSWGVHHLPFLSEAISSCPVESIDFEGVPLRDENIVGFLRSSAISKIRLCGAPLSSIAAFEIASLNQLEAVDLEGSAIDNAGMKALAACKTLKYLCVSGTRISSDALEPWRNHPALEKIILNDTAIGDDDIKSLSTIPTLKSCGLSHTRITLAGIQGIARMPSVEELSLSGENITDTEVGALVNCPRLTELVLLETSCTDEVFETLNKMSRLESVVLSSKAISDSGLRRLVNSHLWTIAVGGPKITLGGLGELQRRLRAKVHDAGWETKVSRGSTREKADQ